MFIVIIKNKAQINSKKFVKIFILKKLYEQWKLSITDIDKVCITICVKNLFYKVDALFFGN